LFSSEGPAVLTKHALRGWFGIAYSALYVQHCFFSAACRAACSALLAQHGVFSIVRSALHT
jgi:hypothetical protein